MCQIIQRTALLVQKLATLTLAFLVFFFCFDGEQVTLQTVAFGDPKEDYEVLEEMAGVLPRSHFQVSRRCFFLSTIL